MDKQNIKNTKNTEKNELNKSYEKSSENYSDEACSTKLNQIFDMRFLTDNMHLSSEQKEKFDESINIIQNMFVSGISKEISNLTNVSSKSSEDTIFKKLDKKFRNVLENIFETQLSEEHKEYQNNGNKFMPILNKSINEMKDDKDFKIMYENIFNKTQNLTEEKNSDKIKSNMKQLLEEDIDNESSISDISEDE